MEQLRNFGDERQMAFCAYCGGGTETRDHVPAKVFLDEPYPTNLPVVPACRSCNEGFSLDEEYVACLIECVVTGTVHADGINREKVKRILRQKPLLGSKLSQARKERKKGVYFDVETDRIKNVVLKLARGHAAFELNEPQLDEPSSLVFIPFPFMSQKDLKDFETTRGSPISIWPEVGSRAMQRLMVNSPGSSMWIPIQPGRYRYLASVDDGLVIRMVVSEYLACEVAWNT